MVRYSRITIRIYNKAITVITRTITMVMVEIISITIQLGLILRIIIVIGAGNIKGITIRNIIAVIIINKLLQKLLL